MTRVRATLAVHLLFVSLACTACGLLLTHGPPAGHPALNDFRCTRSVAGPVLDAVAAAVGIGLSVKSASEQPDYDISAINEILVVGVARAALWSVSAAIGFDKVSKCNAAQRQLAERRANTPPSGAPALVVPTTEVRTVEVTPAADTLVPDEHVQLVARAFEPSGGVFLNKTFRWSSSNDAIASVSASGVVTAHAPGTALIAANTDNVIGTASLVVRPPRDGIERTPP